VTVGGTSQDPSKAEAMPSMGRMLYWTIEKSCHPVVGLTIDQWRSVCTGFTEYHHRSIA
jgi:hypothetical protein